MERERQTRDEPMNSSQRSMTSSIFGGRDPFDDPFFTRPFGSIFEHNSIFDTHTSSDDLPHLNANSSKGLVIEEIDTDGEEEEEEDEGNNGNSGSTSGKGPLIEHPDDEDEVKKETRFNKNHNRVDQSKSKTQSISFKKVTYGGINGAYYTATTTRKSGSDGVVIEDSKEADKTTGQATHRISKGIHDKGHSVTRKLGTDGEVDTVQTLHNLNQDELASFEQEWEGNADRHIPGWNEEFNSFWRPGSGSLRSFGWALESAGRSQSSGRLSSDNSEQTGSSRSQPKKVVRINID